MLLFFNYFSWSTLWPLPKTNAGSATVHNITMTGILSKNWAEERIFNFLNRNLKFKTVGN